MFTQDQALANAIDKLPPGWVWTRDPDSNVGRTLTPLAAEQVLFEQAAESMLAEATPSTSLQLLPDYERVLGPDPCLAPTSSITLQERRNSVHVRWTRTGGAARQDYINLAATLGYAITIDEFQPSRCGVMRCGDRLQPQASQWVWRINLPPLQVIWFRTGASSTGERLGAFGIAWLQCQLSRNAPTHTQLLFGSKG